MKRSKRAVKIRRRWTINPRTKIEESAKIYKRPREKRVVKKTILKF